MNYAVKLMWNDQGEVSVSEIMEIPKSALYYARRFSTNMKVKFVSYSTLEKAERGRKNELFALEVMKMPKEEQARMFEEDYKILKSCFPLKILNRWFQFTIGKRELSSYRAIARNHIAAEIIKRHYNAMTDELSELLTGTGIPTVRRCQNPNVP